MIIPGIIASVHSGGGSYVGPMDLVSNIWFAASLGRAMGSTALGTPLCVLERDSDDATITPDSDPDTGLAPIATIEAFIPAGFTQTGDVVSGSDQVQLVSTTGVKVGQSISGLGIPAYTGVKTIVGGGVIQLSETATGNHAGATLTFGHILRCIDLKDQSENALGLNQDQPYQSGFPMWAVSTDNDQPFLSACFDGKHGIQTQLLASLWSTGEPITAFTVVAMFDNAQENSSPYLIESNTGNFELGCDRQFGTGELETDQDNGVSFARYFADTPAAGLHIIEVVITAAGINAIWVDGVSQVLTPDADPPFPLPAVGPGADLRSDFCRLPSGQFELAIWKSEVSAPDRALVRQNMADFYGIVLP